ncbi:MAG: Mrp/NBP35 family ATP-binding protein [Eubacterium sp.]|nr:Mrp/NBP35 family ATP-binding protein [Eubacterium sp.]
MSEKQAKASGDNQTSGQEEKESFRIEENAFSNIDHIIGVVSGKGGVGKSMVTASLANAMAMQGFSVGILDADITGPSIPKMYGIKGAAESDGNGIYPKMAANGIEIMSTNLLLPNEEDPVIWRGPVIAGVVKQFYTDVIWGQLDYLFVDMPPGTGDVPLTVFQSLPVDGIMIVTSPQDLVRMIVTKAYNMAKMMNIPVLGIIENYSYMLCPHCGEKIYPFGESHIDEIAGDLKVPVLGKIPMDPEYAKVSDAGAFAAVNNTYIDDAIIALRNAPKKEA